VGSQKKASFKVDPDSGELPIEVKVSFNARQVRKNRTLHYTSAIFTITQDGFDDRYQSPFFTYLLSEYKGADERAFFERNFQDLKANLEYLDRNTVPIKIGDTMHKARIKVLLPADMKAHWAWFGTGGMHDKEGFCHRCHTRKEDRQIVFEVIKTKASFFPPDFKMPLVSSSSERNVVLFGKTEVTSFSVCWLTSRRSDNETC
jgi:hypothetical protein